MRLAEPVCEQAARIFDGTSGQSVIRTHNAESVEERDSLHYSFVFVPELLVLWKYGVPMLLMTSSVYREAVKSAQASSVTDINLIRMHQRTQNSGKCLVSLAITANYYSGNSSISSSFEAMFFNWRICRNQLPTEWRRCKRC